MPEFYEDMYVELVNQPPVSPAVTQPCTPTDPGVVIGQIGHTIVTIINDDQPAGAVDRTWNKNNTSDSIPPGLYFPGTSGNGGTVYAEAEQPDGRLIIAGSFTSFDSNPYNRIARLLLNGYQDPTFLVAPNSGANDFIAALALQSDGKIIVGRQLYLLQRIQPVSHCAPQQRRLGGHHLQSRFGRQWHGLGGVSGYQTEESSSAASSRPTTALSAVISRV